MKRVKTGYVSAYDELEPGSSASLWESPML